MNLIFKKYNGFLIHQNELPPHHSQSSEKTLFWLILVVDDITTAQILKLFRVKVLYAKLPLIVHHFIGALSCESRINICRIVEAR
jgi:hypothetical protein